MIFVYKGIDKEGEPVRDKIEAASLEEAKSKLRAKRVIYEWIKEDSPSIFDTIRLRRRYSLPANDLARLSRELATYIRSGVTIVNALKIVQTHYEHNKKLSLFLSTLSTYLDEGKNFYSALEMQGVVELPEFYKQSIRVSESSGILDEVLMELSRFLKEQDRVVKEVRNAFAYPTFMLVLSLFMVAFMLTFVVPQITSIFVNMDQEIPAVTAFVIATAEFFADNYQFLILIFLVVAGGFASLRKLSRAFRYATDRIILATPVFGTIVLKNELGRFAYIGALLLRSGVPFVQTIDLAANILGNRVLAGIFEDAATKVVEGKRLSHALYESKVRLDEAFVQAIALGEETSQIQSILSNVSELYFEENRDRIRFMLSLLEPVLMLFVGGVIGFIVAAMLLPIFSMSIG